MMCTVYNAAWAVSFFIILSGFLESYLDEGGLSFSGKDWMGYMTRKLKKLYPLMFITTILAIPYSGLVTQISNHALFGVNGDGVGIITLLRTLLLLQSWFPKCVLLI